MIDEIQPRYGNTLPFQLLGQSNLYRPEIMPQSLIGYIRYDILLPFTKPIISQNLLRLFAGHIGWPQERIPLRSHSCNNAKEWETRPKRNLIKCVACYAAHALARVIIPCVEAALQQQKNYWVPLVKYNNRYLLNPIFVTDR